MGGAGGGGKGPCVGGLAPFATAAAAKAAGVISESDIELGGINGKPTGRSEGGARE